MISQPYRFTWQAISYKKIKQYLTKIGFPDEALNLFRNIGLSISFLCLSIYWHPFYLLLSNFTNFDDENSIFFSFFASVQKKEGIYRINTTGYLNWTHLKIRINGLFFEWADYWQCSRFDGFHFCIRGFFTWNWKKINVEWTQKTNEMCALGKMEFDFVIRRNQNRW